MPSDATVAELYEGHTGFEGWWRVRNPISVRFQSLAEIPGRSSESDSRADTTFAGSCTFACWNFGNSSFDELTTGVTRTAGTNSARVIEGFPGVTIQQRLLHRNVSYKGTTAAHRNERCNIIEALKSAPYRLPISDSTAATVVDDAEGDALDALVLLVASWCARRLAPQTWQEQFNRLQGHDDALIEGWFPV